MTLYLDTSSLIKLYLTESHSDRVSSWANTAKMLATSRVSYPEAMSGLARRWREGALDATGFHAVRQALTEQWTDFIILDLNERGAAELTIKHGLRGLDAIQLAAALDLVAAVTSNNPQALVYFSSFDARLLRAAEQEGLSVLGDS